MSYVAIRGLGEDPLPGTTTTTGPKPCEKQGGYFGPDGKGYGACAPPPESPYVQYIPYGVAVVAVLIASGATYWAMRR